ncbi:hypothetical protein GCM10007063_04630 [Lentibacillus kapialis]|uniref:Uncharacterized protein n=1 Tax=Lentibacillus kapialis TaxID=340214 RepID=A0A917PMU4_9BACI|nr:hypothetical protein [Lentibacillus kapialis]GGJ85163.1 hypothetical protein GCM10007063_04630 [Lentibacillus kapialis]
MNSEQISSKQEQPMRVVLPDLYKKITDKLEEDYNIHKYDIQAQAVQESSGYEAIIYFGDSYAHKNSQYFSNEAIKHKNPEIAEFIEKVGSACKEVMIADYFKMMRPK